MPALYVKEVESILSYISRTSQFLQVHVTCFIESIVWHVNIQILFYIIIT